ncbi:MAG: hypothetical protein OEM05_08950 [Myxococcales bacterium]|nr:hypothetical protein [Myxococcales bacterium]
MRRRFGRGRTSKTGGEGARAPIDAQRALDRIVAAGIVPVDALTPASVEGIPDDFAVLGTGETGGRERVAVGFAPEEGGDAALATLAFAQRLAAEDGFAGDALAVAPQWSIASRRRLALVGDVPFRFRAVAASALAAGDNTVRPEPGVEPPVGAAERVIAALASPADRDLFRRALAALEGLAAKHGGAVRGYGAAVELVLLARRVAALRADREGLTLETLLPDRSTAPLNPAALATAMDRLEGSLRKRLNDRRVNSSEEGLRAQLAPALASVAGLRATRLWPLGGGEAEVLDLAGADGDGRAVIGAVRARLTLPGLASILDAALSLRPALSGLLGTAEGLVPGDGFPRLLLAAQEIDAPVFEVLSALSVEPEVYDVKPRRGREPELIRREDGGATRPDRSGAQRRRAAPRPQAAQPVSPDAAAPRFEEISLFDLEDEGRAAAPASAGESGRGRRRGRSRGRRRGQRGAGSDAPAASEAAERSEAPRRDPHEAGPDESARREAAHDRDREDQEEDRREEAEPEDSELLAVADADDLAEILAPIDSEVQEQEEEIEPSYDDEEAGEEGETEEDRPHRVQRAKPDPQPVPAEPPRPPRRRTAFVAHADRQSLVAAILLARDLRLVEGFWVYPQSELMTFFRSIATDLREDTPIQLVGFHATHDALQAAALYGERLTWFDHHAWPPEDLERLRQTIGVERVHVEPGTGSSLPAVLAGQTRRSRFSDKLVELVTGRFSQHDFERWGRVWWQRLAEIVGRSGDRRSDVDPLLIGRPSDLAREAASVPTPPEPVEVAYVSHRDFRLVHFGGYTLVVVPTPAELDLHIAARVARERYGAELSLSLVAAEGGGIGAELVVLGGDEGRERRSLDLGRMVEHLVAKHTWIESLPNADHVARVRVRDLPSRAERLDDVIGEIAMGRSILEG